MKKLIVPALISFFLIETVFAANLTVNVRNNYGEMLEGALVALIAFPQEGSEGEPISDKSYVKNTDTAGQALFEIEPGYDYMILTSKQGMKPTIKDQIYSPMYAPIRTDTNNDMVEYRYLHDDPFYKWSSGQVEVYVQNISSGVIIFSEVRNVTTDEPVAFGAAKAPVHSTLVTSTVAVFNIPQATQINYYRLFVGIPEDQRGYSVLLDTTIAQGQVYTVTISSENFSGTERVDTGDEYSGDVSFEGVVVDQDDKTGIKDCVVILKKKNPDASGWQWDNPVDVAETRTDSGGYFSFYDVEIDSYAIQIGKKGYEGRFITGQPGDPYPDDGLRPDEHTWIVSWDSYYTGNIELPKALGFIEGYIKLYDGEGGTYPVPNAHVEAHSDWSEWPSVPTLQETCIDGGLDNYFTTGYDRSGRTHGYTNSSADGYFRIDGLGAGNYIINVCSDYYQDYDGYCYNSGSDEVESVSGSNWQRSGDDLRVTVSSMTWGCSVYDVNGVVIIDTCSVANLTPMEIVIGTRTPPSGEVSGTITFDVPENSFFVASTEAITVFAYEQTDNHENQKMYFTVIQGTMLNKTTTYTINVTTDTKYWIEIKSRRWGILGRSDRNADLTSKESLSGIDFKVARGGLIRGIVRLPDGSIFKKIYYNNDTLQLKYEERMEFDVDGVDIESYGWGEMRDDGYFETNGLVPGTYNITARGIKRIEYYGSNPQQMEYPLEWPDVTIKNVVIRQGQETFVEIQLKSGCLVMPKTPALPPLPAVEDGYEVSHTQYMILKVPSSIGVSRNTFSSFVGEDASDKIDFIYLNDTWYARRILAGRYDFMLCRLSFFNPGMGDTHMPPNDFFGIAFISKLKNTEISYDSLKKDVTTYLEFESGTMGQSTLSGTVGGLSLFNQEDIDLITDSGMDKFFSYIPSVMLYDADGQLKGFSMALPLMERVPAWDERMQNNSFTLEWFKNELESYPLNYKIERLPAGKYTAVFETPNYPPMMKIVHLVSGDNELNVSFDDNVIVGSSIEGVVVSTAGVGLSDVTIKLNHRTVKKTITTDSNGAFQVIGLPPGTYRMTINKSGYAPGAERFALGRDAKYFNGSDAIVLIKADAWIEGTVYSQKMPTPKVIVGAKIVAYSETLNTLHPNKMLPVHIVKTDGDGKFFIDNIVSSHIYNIFVIYPGKLLEWKTLGTAKYPLSSGQNPGYEFVLKSLPPRLKINMTKIYEHGRFQYKFFIESPKKIINPSNPNALAAPYCRYCPIASSAGDFDSSTAIEVLPSVGPEFTDSDGNTVYTYSLKIPVIEDSEYYKLRVEATDGSTDYSEYIVFGPKIEAKTKRDVKDELALGGDISIDDTGMDSTQITLDPGSLTAANAETSTIKEDNVDIPIGGFLSAMPNFNLSKTGSAKSAAMAKMVESVVASDVYEIDLNYAQMNKALSLNLKYDQSKITEEDLANMVVCQYNSGTEKWETVPGVVTVDPMSSSVSVDVESINTASNMSISKKSPRAGRAAIKNGMYSINKAAATSQSGIYAVFKVDPSTAKQYAGSDFSMLNFPNPFNLKSKDIQMQDVNSDYMQTIKGTLIKYTLPSEKTGHVKIYIYNLAGELVKEIDEGDQNGGYFYYTEWDGKNDNGEECASGVYFVNVKCNGKKLNSKPHKMAILK